MVWKALKYWNYIITNETKKHSYVLYIFTYCFKTTHNILRCIKFFDLNLSYLLIRSINIRNKSYLDCSIKKNVRFSLERILNMLYFGRYCDLLYSAILRRFMFYFYGFMSLKWWSTTNAGKGSWLRHRNPINR